MRKILADCEKPLLPILVTIDQREKLIEVRCMLIHNYLNDYHDHYELFLFCLLI